MRWSWLLGAVLVACVAGCSPENAVDAETEAAAEIVAASLPTRPVTFRVALPTGTRGPVYVRVLGLDEFDFLRAAELKQGSDGLWTAAVPVENGALLRYRFDRASEQDWESFNTRREVAIPGVTSFWRYVTITASTTEVRDTVAMWADATREITGGSVTGQILDARTGKPVSDVEVSIAGMHAATGYEGRFRFERLAPGTYPLTVHHAAGRYGASSTSVTVTEGQQAAATVRLQEAAVVNVTFNVTLPADTPAGAEVRLYGNAEQLSGWFINAPNDMNGLGSPTAVAAGAGRARVTLRLYEGQHVAYRYHLGIIGYSDERTSSGPALRQFIVSKNQATRTDTVERWRHSNQVFVTFNLRVPANTPDIPVAFVTGPSHWMTRGSTPGSWRAVIAATPGDRLSYSYRLGDDQQFGLDASGSTETRTVPIGNRNQTVSDTVTRWSGLIARRALGTTEQTEVTVRFSLPPEAAGQSWTLAGDAPFAGVTLTPRSDDPAVAEGHVQARPGTFRVSVAGCAGARPVAGTSVVVKFERQVIDLYAGRCSSGTALTARNAAYVRGIYLPDWFTPAFPRLTAGVLDGARANGATSIALSSVFSYGQTSPTPTLEYRPLLAGAVRTPSSELFAQASAVKTRGLGVFLVPQFNMEMTQDGMDGLSGQRSAEWWDAWLGLARDNWLMQAAMAQQAGASTLLLPGPVFHVFQGPWAFSSRAVFDDWDRRLGLLVDEVRTIFPGEIVMSGGVRELTAVGRAGIVSVTTYDIGQPELPASATLDQWVAAYEQRFVEVVDPLHAAWSRPVLVYSLHAPNEASPGDPSGEYTQARQLEALYRAIERRPWILGSYSWAWMMTPGPDLPQDGVRGRLGEAVQAKWYARLAEAPLR